MKTLFPEPRNEYQEQLENAYQLGLSEGMLDGRAEGIAAAQTKMRDAQAGVQYAMGVREELGE